MLLSLIHNTDYTMHCIALTLVETQCKARIDLNPILVFLCVAFLRQIIKNHYFKCLQMQRKALYVLWLYNLLLRSGLHLVGSRGGALSPLIITRINYHKVVKPTLYG